MTSVVKVQSPKLFEAVVSQLREAIINGELVPGDKLRETELADQFGVSRGPIREALRELAREGLVIDLPRRGTLVSVPNFGDLVEVYDLRQALESFAIGEAIRRATREDLATFASLYDASMRLWHSADATNADRWAADYEFHREILKVAGNTRMIAFYEQVLAQCDMLIRLAVRMNHALELSPPDVMHKSIADAIQARDVDAAVAAVVDHYRLTRERLFTFAGGEAPDPSTSSEDAARTAPRKARGGKSKSNR
jgi:DNA-binding GntR family transcriptional regulator